MSQDLRGAALLLAALTVALACARYEEVWSGVVLVDGGQRVKLAADPGLCGCLTLRNTTRERTTVRATFHGLQMGTVVLPPEGTIVARFDSAGERARDVYLLDALDQHGKAIRIADAIQVGGSSWHDCSTMHCEWGTLSMRAASSQQR